MILRDPMRSRSPEALATLRRTLRMDPCR